jgi:hypothetical protein
VGILVGHYSACLLLQMKSQFDSHFWFRTETAPRKPTPQWISTQQAPRDTNIHTLLAHPGDRLLHKFGLHNAANNAPINTTGGPPGKAYATDDVIETFTTSTTNSMHVSDEAVACTIPAMALQDYNISIAPTMPEVITLLNRGHQ